MALTPLDFPASPTVGQLYPDPPVTGQPTYRWDGAQWLSYAAASLPTPTKPANYGKKNYIINGAMQVSQENGATAGTIAAGFYPVDTFLCTASNLGTQTGQQVASITPAGSPNRLRVTATVADASVGSAEYCLIYHNLEGLRVADLLAGTASAKTVTLQFGVKAPAGTYCVAFQNGAANRSYVAEYVIAAGEANMNVIKTVTVNLDQTGTWAVDNTKGLIVVWALMVGSSLQTAANAWTAGNLLGSSNQFNFMGTINNVFELFDVSLTEGSVAPPFQVPDYASELALCKRYWIKMNDTVRFWATAGSQTNEHQLQFPVEMRAAPSIPAPAPTGAANLAVGSPFVADINAKSCRFGATSAAAGECYGTSCTVIINARL